MLDVLALNFMPNSRTWLAWLTARRAWFIVCAIAIANTLAAGLISFYTWSYSFFEVWTMLNLLSFFLSLSLLSVWLGFQRFEGKLLWFALVALILAVIAVFVFTALFEWIYGQNMAQMLDRNFLFEKRFRVTLMAGLSFGLLFAGAAIAIAHWRNREVERRAMRLELEKEQSELSRQLSETRLRLLQVQIEPHFVFNTLGSAQQLAQDKAPEAAQLLSALIRFLRSAIPNIRDQVTTLEQEEQLLNAYLEVMKTRLGARLHYQIDIPAALKKAQLPPGMLLTLVENAIKHGIEPIAAGGVIKIHAHIEAEQNLIVQIADTGRGLHGELSSGLGLANIQERLAAIYNDKARLLLSTNTPQGFVARVELPYVTS